MNCNTCKYFGKIGSFETTENISYFESNLPLLKGDLICKYDHKTEYVDAYDVYDGSSYQRVVAIRYHNPNILNKFNDCSYYKISIMKRLKLKCPRFRFLKRHKKSVDKLITINYGN